MLILSNIFFEVNTTIFVNKNVLANKYISVCIVTFYCPNEVLYLYIFNLQKELCISQINIFTENKYIFIANTFCIVNKYISIDNAYFVARKCIFYISNKYLLVNKYILLAINI